jgi:hypothetical protein
MKQTGRDILIGFRKHWQLLLWIETSLYAISSAIFIWFLSLSLIMSSIAFALIFTVVLFWKQPWKIDLKKVSHYIDNNSSKLEYSSGLLFQETNELSGLARLQQQKISKALQAEIKNISPKHHLKATLFISALLVALGYLAFYLGFIENDMVNENKIPKEEKINFWPTSDSLAEQTEAPVLKNQQVIINYPSYTGMAKSISSKMDIKAVEGSRVSWKLGFEGAVTSVSLESMGNQRSLNKINQEYRGSAVLQSSGFYSFRFTDTAGTTYASDLFAMEVTKDKAPIIQLKNLKQFTSFNYDDDKIITFGTSITDDFGVSTASIIATVSKGTGESVKFREERLSFDTPVFKGNKELDLTKSLNLDAMNMEPGDELYFYIEAQDTKEPKANLARSETYFAVIKDTIDYGPGVEAGLGVDLMPDYFRSQRQLIIDTKQLIEDRAKLSENEFNATSNALGFDQKSLRLKYGQFMGDEAEGGRGASGEISDSQAHDHDHDEDPLADYTHAHDTDNEHNLVADDHEHEHDEDESTVGEDPLAEYLHNHGDPESSSLFTDSLKSKLRQALNIMWDAELHLRLNDPEKSLPFQYEALKLIQEIKNSARIYVHRIGFDPPPIKEEVRLSGDIKDVNNFSKKEKRDDLDPHFSIKRAILRLEELKTSNSELNQTDRALFEKAGNELAEKAIAKPGSYLKTLQQLKHLSEKQEIAKEMIIEVQKGLLKTIPDLNPEPQHQRGFGGKLNELVLKELELNEQ